MARGATLLIEENKSTFVDADLIQDKYNPDIVDQTYNILGLLMTEFQHIRDDYKRLNYWFKCMLSWIVVAMISLVSASIHYEHYWGIAMVIFFSMTCFIALVKYARVLVHRMKERTEKVSRYRARCYAYLAEWRNLPVSSYHTRVKTYRNFLFLLRWEKYREFEAAHHLDV